MSGNSSGSDHPGGGSFPKELKPSVSEKGIDNERTHRRLPTTPMSGSGTALSKTYRLEESSTSCMSDIELNQGHDRNKSNPTNVQPHDSRSEMTGYSGGGSPESLQTSDSESFDGQTSKTRTKESGSSSSGIADNLMIALGKGQAGMSSETTAKRDGTQSLRFPRPGSLSSRLPGPKILSIRWNKGKEEDIEGNETFELSLYRCNILSHVIRIACWPNDYHTLMFMFYNESTIENLKKSLYEKGYILKNGTQEIRFFTNIEKDPEQIKNEIEEVIKKFKVDFSIQSRCVESNLPDDKLAEKCIEFNEECKKDKRGNIVMTYSKSKGLWIAGCDEDELKKHEKRLMEEVILQKNVIQNPTGISNSSMGVCFPCADPTIRKDIMLATVTLPIWRDGKAKEKEQLRSCISSLLQCLHDRNILTVMIPLMFDRLLLQWPGNTILKAIIFWRRHFIDTTIFYHPDREKCMKLLPVFQGMKDEPHRETIAIRIDKKSFTDQKVQVLVNTVGRDLNLKRGQVSNSILTAAGNKIQKEANEKFPNGLLRGQLLVTDAYNLRGKGIQKVFHGSLLQWNDIESIAVIKSFVAKCLHLASENGMTSIAFPALGTGNLAYEHKSVATAMFETVRSFMEGSLYTSVKEIVFNAFDLKSQQAFFQEEKKYLNNPCQSKYVFPV